MRQIHDHELKLISGGKEAWEAIGDVMRRGQNNNSNNDDQDPNSNIAPRIADASLGWALSELHPAAPVAYEVGHGIGTYLYNNNDTVQGTAIEMFAILDEKLNGIISGVR